MTTKAKRRLSDFEINEISFVDKAANAKKYLVIKSAEAASLASESDVAALLSEIPSEKFEEFNTSIQSLENPEGVIEIFKCMMPEDSYRYRESAVHDYYHNANTDSLIILKKISEMLMAFLRKGDIDRNVVGNVYAGSSTPFSPEPYMLEKSMNEETKLAVEKALSEKEDAHKAELAKAAARIEELEKAEATRQEEIKKAADAARLVEFEGKAELLSVLGVEKSFSTVLKNSADADSDSYSQIEALLLKAAEILKNGEKLESKGQDAITDGDISTEAKLDAEVKKLMDADKALTRAQAVTKAVTNNPELYK